MTSLTTHSRSHLYRPGKPDDGSVSWGAAAYNVTCLFLRAAALGGDDGGFGLANHGQQRQSNAVDTSPLEQWLTLRCMQITYLNSVVMPDAPSSDSDDAGGGASSAEEGAAA